MFMAEAKHLLIHIVARDTPYPRPALGKANRERSASGPSRQRPA
jgi:hypothetical protein